ncbi:MAG TPA: protein kinase [Thermoanaerobaculia bacterium]|nr:protein kinase [Thermoanaerobaculia bacterium]
MSEALRLAGREVGRYRVVSLLGTGGMGAVYDAVDVTLGRHVALKILPPSVVSDPDRLRRFAQEARAASALNHPHVITVYDIGTFDVDEREIHYISMEKVEGATLSDTLEAGALPLERAIEVVLQVIDAVATAHAAGIIHRDLKPDNVMVAASGYAKVLDFGLAKLQEPVTDSAATNVMSTQTGIVLGTAGYMAPERAQGRVADHRADLFSIGCILYEAVTGQRAFHGASVYDTLYRIIHSEPEPMESFAPNVPGELRRIVAKSLAKDPDERYQSARELSIDLRQLLRSMRTETKQFALPATNRRRGVVAVSIAAAIVIVAIAIVIALHRRPAAAAEPVLRRITSGGDAVAATISPDGKYVAYLVSNDSGQSMRIVQLATRQELVLIPAAQNQGFRGHTFTPDGNAIVYVIRDGANPIGTLFRLSTLGGKPERVFEGIDQAPSFSPDGRRIAYLRPDYPSRGQSALMVAGIDGSLARPVAIRRYPELFTPVSFGGPSWSPDGSIIAAAVNRAEDPEQATLIGFDPDRGTAKPLSDGEWRTLGQAAWMPDGSGIVVTGTRRDDPLAAASLPLRLWFVPYPSGRPRRLTNDLLMYRLVSISSDGRSLITIGVDVTSQLWRVPLSSEATAQKISSGRLDGFLGVSLAPDGRIAYSAADDFNVGIALTKPDGTDRIQLTRETAVRPAAFTGGIAYVAPVRNGNEIRMVSFDGRQPKTIVARADAEPIAVTRDGEWLAFDVNRLLWKIRRDGSGRKPLTTFPVFSAAWSPSGDRIAIVYDDRGHRRLGVIPAGGGAVTWSIPQPAAHKESTLRWTPDGTALLVNDHQNDIANIWRIAFDKPPEKLTNLAERDLYEFDVAPDGKSDVASRGHLTRDAILITEFH